MCSCVRWRGYFLSSIFFLPIYFLHSAFWTYSVAQELLDVLLLGLTTSSEWIGVSQDTLNSIFGNLLSWLRGAGSRERAEGTCLESRRWEVYYLLANCGNGMLLLKLAGIEISRREGTFSRAILGRPCVWIGNIGSSSWFPQFSFFLASLFLFFCLVKIMMWAGNVCLQFRKPAVSWDASKEIWPAGWGKDCSPVLCSYETPPGVLHSAVGPPAK